MQDGNTLVGAVPQLAEHATVSVEEITRVGSSQITPAHWMIAREPDQHAVP